MTIDLFTPMNLEAEMERNIFVTLLFLFLPQITTSNTELNSLAQYRCDASKNEYILILSLQSNVWQCRNCMENAFVKSNVSTLCLCKHGYYMRLKNSNGLESCDVAQTHQWFETDMHARCNQIDNQQQEVLQDNLLGQSFADFTGVALNRYMWFQPDNFELAAYTKRECWPCATGKVYFNNLQTRQEVYDHINTNYYNPGSECILCHNNAIPNNDNSACIQCKKDEIKSSLTTCSQCLAGTVPSADQTECIQLCPQNAFLTVNFFTFNISYCKCEPGYEYRNLSSPDFECVPCAAGQYETSSTCMQCPVGKYSESITQTSCKSCEQGNFSPLGSTSEQACIECAYNVLPYEYTEPRLIKSNLLLSSANSIQINTYSGFMACIIDLPSIFVLSQYLFHGQPVWQSINNKHVILFYNYDLGWTLSKYNTTSKSHAIIAYATSKDIDEDYFITFCDDADSCKPNEWMEQPLLFSQVELRDNPYAESEYGTCQYYNKNGTHYCWWDSMCLFCASSCVECTSLTLMTTSSSTSTTPQPTTTSSTTPEPTTTSSTPEPTTTPPPTTPPPPGTPPPSGFDSISIKYVDTCTLNDLQQFTHDGDCHFCDNGYTTISSEVFDVRLTGSCWTQTNHYTGQVFTFDGVWTNCAKTTCDIPEADHSFPAFTKMLHDLRWYLFRKSSNGLSAWIIHWDAAADVRNTFAYKMMKPFELGWNCCHRFESTFPACTRPHGNPQMAFYILRQSTECILLSEYVAPPATAGSVIMKNFSTIYTDPCSQVDAFQEYFMRDNMCVKCVFGYVTVNSDLFSIKIQNSCNSQFNGEWINCAVYNCDIQDIDVNYPSFVRFFRIGIKYVFFYLFRKNYDGIPVWVIHTDTSTHYLQTWAYKTMAKREQPWHEFCGNTDAEIQLFYMRSEKECNQYNLQNFVQFHFKTNSCPFVDVSDFEIPENDFWDLWPMVTASAFSRVVNMTCNGRPVYRNRHGMYLEYSQNYTLEQEPNTTFLDAYFVYERAQTKNIVGVYKPQLCLQEVEGLMSMYIPAKRRFHNPTSADPLFDGSWWPHRHWDLACTKFLSANEFDENLYAVEIEIDIHKSLTQPGAGFRRLLQDSSSEQKQYVQPEICVKCDVTVCAVGYYLTENCAACLPCASTLQQLPGSLWSFSTHGLQLGNENSCIEKCPEGYFQDTQFCTPYSYSNPSDCKEDNTFFVKGSELFDSKCEHCQDCEGKRLIQQCLEDSDTICDLCPSSEEHENRDYMHTDCSFNCKHNFLRQIFNSSRQHDRCIAPCNECLPGSYRPDLVHNCSHCEECDAAPSNSVFVYQCEWQCAPNFALNFQSQQCEPLPSNSLVKTPSKFEFSCNLGFFVNDNYECAKCEVATPNAEQYNITWKWQARVGNCIWACSKDHFFYKHKETSEPQCLTWDLYKTTVKADRSVSTLSLEQPNTISTYELPISWNEMLVFGAVLLSAVFFISCVC